MNNDTGSRRPKIPTSEVTISEVPRERKNAERKCRRIAASSPLARGRSERVFHTLQGRLTKELAVAGTRDRGRRCLQARQAVAQIVGKFGGCFEVASPTRTITGWS